MFALSVLYRVAPDRAAPKFRWVSVGAVTATVLWLVASLGFSLYVSLFSSYGKTYGSLAGVVVLLLWLWITNYVVLLGAEINAEAEQQTGRDTTTGRPLPRGRRGAVKADSLPGDPAPRPASSLPRLSMIVRDVWHPTRRLRAPRVAHRRRERSRDRAGSSTAVRTGVLMAACGGTSCG